MAVSKPSMKSLVAYRQIRDRILNGTKLPGTRLILQDLENELNIGKGPIREALMRLDKSGLVKNIPYKGAVVATPPQQNELFHIFDLRVDLEIKLALEAMDKLNETDFAVLDTLNKRMHDFDEDYYQLDRQFHSIINEASGFSLLCNIAEKMIFSVETFLNPYPQGKENKERFNREHSQILEALRDKDPEKLKKNLASNIQGGLDIIKETYGRLTGTKV